MVLEVRNEELRVGYYGLRSEARDLHASFLAFVDDREVLLAAQRLFLFLREPGSA